MDHLIGGFDGLLPYAKEIERCGTSGQMFKALAYCNQRYINSLKLVRERLEEPDTEINCNSPSDETEDVSDEMNSDSEDTATEPAKGKEKKRHGYGIFK